VQARAIGQFCRDSRVKGRSHTLRVAAQKNAFLPAQLNNANAQQRMAHQSTQSVMCLEMTGNAFLHSHSLPIPISQFPFLPIPILKFNSRSHFHPIPIGLFPFPNRHTVPD